MAIYIPLRKVRDDGDSVEYRFGDYSGEVVIVEPAPGDEKGFLSRLAARKVSSPRF